MKIAVLSDIHSNHIALEACVDYIEKQKIEHIIFLGDYVSNCAYPEKTMQLIYDLSEKKQCWFVLGNREELLLKHAQGADDGWTIPSTTSGSILYTYNHLEQKDIDFFSTLKSSDCLEVQGYPSIAFCHGSMDSSVERMDEKKAEKYFEKYKVNIILCGHTHKSGCWKYAHGKVINAGSVGTPMNEGGNAEFVILHGNALGWREEFVTVPYDRMAVVQELEESGLLEQSKVFGYMIKDLLVTKKDRWNDLMEHVQEICKNETGTIGDAMNEEYLEKAAKALGIM